MSIPSKMRLIYQEEMVIKRSIEDVFFYLGHTFENADTWLIGCRRIKAFEGYERFGMWKGKKYVRHGGGLFKIGTLRMEEEVVLFEENKRFMMKTFSNALQPYWDYQFEKIDDNTTRWKYKVYSASNNVFHRIYQSLFFGIAVHRIKPSHLHVKARLENNDVLNCEASETRLSEYQMN